jgi:Helix-turn-helix domain
MASDSTTNCFTQLLTETDASKKLAVSIGALRRWRREGRGPAFTRLERCVRYDVRALESFLADHSSAKNQLPADNRLYGADGQSRRGESMSDLKLVRK